MTAVRGRQSTLTSEPHNRSLTKLPSTRTCATQALLVPQASFGHGGDACTKMVLTPSDSRERSRPASFGKIARLKVGIDRLSEAAVNNPQSSLTLESIPASRFFQEGLVQSVIYAGVSAVLCLAGC